MKADLLITEADKELAGLYREFFSDWGIEVETAADGLECLDKLRRFEPHVLVLDLELPWGGGEGVLARMREDVDVPLVPLVFVTGDSSRSKLAERSRVPTVCCFSKPFRLTALLEGIRLAATRESRRPALI